MSETFATSMPTVEAVQDDPRRAATIIRSSSLPQYMDCPRRWAARHLWAEIHDAGYKLRRIESSVGAAVGSGTHAGAGYMLTSKMETGELGNKTEAEQRALDELAQRLRDGVVWDQTTRDKNTAERQTLRHVGTYRVHVAPTLQPIAVEERLDAKIADGWALSGQCDILEFDILNDTKTGTLKRANGAQYGSYSMLWRSYGYEVNGIVETFVPRVNVRKEQPAPEIQKYDVGACEQQAWAVIDRIRADVSRFRRSGDPWAFMPNPMSVLCSPKYCAAHGTQWCTAHKEAFK